MGVLTAKVVSMCVLGGVSLIVGILPIKLSQYFDWKSERSKKSNFLLSALSCFGAGVILTTCLTHMLPEVNEFLEFNIQQQTIPDTGLPLAEIFVLCGFFMIYIVEELVHMVIQRWHTEGFESGRSNTELTENAVQELEAEASHGDLGHQTVGIDIMTANEGSFQVRGLDTYQSSDYGT
ncbi:hypothetical protein TCAL_09730 [Tigriopus californicus]|uniref:Zinc/iron permease n=1 Tax=Tigriopus californicus TaxID=6832 RepID=A0A553NV47_TIGCA|nr:hypothetical protein TCAL_09730 [Tigriopus californicus]|eukprot:TCALIF_09730-PA protein Name:"Similar to SLC39A3 Zinc transporter ZIP3 (Bos taurus)" AED:0.03 eAED:0.07 QI:0/-1/0/1/-1/1/1/0/178